MKKFKIAPLPLAIAAAIAFLPATHAETPSKGDLSVYSSGEAKQPPTILLVAEASTYMNYSDLQWDHTADVELIDVYPRPSGTNPEYKRYFYYNSISKSRSPTRLTRLKDAIFYLMDTPGAIPDDYKVGLSRYSGGTLVLNNPALGGDSLTSNIVVAAKTLGPITDYEWAKDDKGNYIPALDDWGNPKVKLINGKDYPVYEFKYIKRGGEPCETDDKGKPYTREEKEKYCTKIESQRYKIKKYIAAMCSADRLCTGEAPMASAYAEAGAYILGTKTSRLTHQIHLTQDSKDKDDELTDAQKSVFPYTRALRDRHGRWEYCPINKRERVIYTTPQGPRIRIECKEEDWVWIGPNNVADVAWAGGDPTQEKLDALKAQGKGDYEILWRRVEGLPHGFAARSTAYNPVTGELRPWGFSKDSFQNRNPTDTNLEGSPDGWNYSIDDIQTPHKSLVPVLHYRIFRKKGTLGWRQQWEFCPREKAKLVDYIYSSYRLMCDENDWIPINQGNINEINEKYRKNYSTKLEWTCGIAGCNIGANNPVGINWQYWYDPILNPYNGWKYYYDRSFTSSDYPPLPPTLNTGFSTSGIRNSDPDTRVGQSYQYDTPLSKQCLPDKDNPHATEGFDTETIDSPPSAIFFFTAGWPQSAAFSPRNEMNMSLTPSWKNYIDAIGGNLTQKECDTSGLDGYIFPTNSHWGCIGAYAKRLRDPSKNPANVSVKTGVFLFTSRLQELPQTGVKNGIPIYDCDAIRRPSQRNACMLGSYGYGFGEGGFFQSKANKPHGPQDNPQRSFEDLALAFRKMSENLNDDVTMSATNLPITPADTFKPDTLLPYGYLPFIGLKGKANTDVQWKGNVRKYTQVGRGFQDKNGNSPFNTKASASAILRATTNDLWSSESKGNAYVSNRQTGGVFEKIPTPTVATTDTPRHVYISNIRTTEGSDTLELVTPNNIKKVTNVLTGATQEEVNTLQRLLLNYMGYTIDKYDQSTSIQQIIDTFANGKNKTLGGVYHSLPIALTSEVTYQDDQFKPSKQYILFGAMDNALHIVDNETGVEYMSYFPKEALDSNEQYKAITPELKYIQKNENEKPRQAFGVDGPWSSYVTYKTPDGNGNSNELEADKLYVFGGLRLGGKAYYGLNLTGIGKNGFKPKQLFTITPETQYKHQSIFNRLGYTWAKPVITKIKWQGKPKVVAVLTGGYDISYDDTDVERIEKGITDQETKGNAIYIVDVETGNPLIVASNTAGNTGISTASNSDNALVNNSSSAVSFNSSDSVIPVLNSNLKYSVVSTVKTLDRNADDLADSIYFTDLNGQIFRLDIDNAASKGEGSNPSVRLIRIANLKDPKDGLGPRLYETPIVTIHKNKDGQRFAAVSVASGDRTNPDIAEEKPNRVYVIYDKDVGQINFFDPNSSLLKTKDVQISDLIDKPTTTINSNYTKKGWTYPLTKFNVVKKDENSKTPTFTSREVTYNNDTKYPVKAFGPMSAIANKLYIAAYNPYDGLTHQCSIEAQGSSEAYQFCLPYGICEVGKVEVSEPQRIRLGKGPQNIMITSTPDNPNNRQLVTQKETKGKPGSGLRGEAVSTGINAPLSSTAPAIPATFKFTSVLRPMGWYDIQLATPDTSSKVTTDGNS